MARRLLWASLALAPITILVDVFVHPDKTVLFVLAALSLVPLAWLIGEATEHAGEHTGPRIGGVSISRVSAIERAPRLLARGGLGVRHSIPPHAPGG